MDSFSKKDYKELMEEIHQRITEEDRIRHGEHQNSNLIQVLHGPRGWENSFSHRASHRGGVK